MGHPRQCEEFMIASELCLAQSSLSVRPWLARWGDPEMDTLFIALFEILSFGAIVVLVVLGLGIIASMMGIFNFAQGEFVLLGAYITYLVHSAACQSPSAWWRRRLRSARLGSCSSVS